ncbi:MAG: superoxide dismutase family protein [Verrucomicrobiales bacterium]|nr:superoxide dismutase family protein [Verrucomicrobiales bacterium]
MKKLHLLLLAILLIFIGRNLSGQDVLKSDLSPITGSSSVTGEVTFTRSGDELIVFGVFRGLQPNMLHALHIHEFGDLTNQGKNVGPHFAPNRVNDKENQAQRDAGDLGNVLADENGNAQFVTRTKDLTLVAGPSRIAGRALIIYAGRDLGIDGKFGDNPMLAGGIISSTDRTKLSKRTLNTGETIYLPSNLPEKAKVKVEPIEPVIEEIEKGLQKGVTRLENLLQNVGETLESAGE